MAGAKGKGRGRRGAATNDGLELGSDKLYFKIGEVAEIVGVAPHVLRYWESEFRAIRPQKSRSQQRVYRRRDVETLLKIKHLLYDQKYTIAGARQQLAEDREGVQAAAPAHDYRLRRSVAHLRRCLDALRSVLDSDERRDPAAADPAAFLRARRFAPELEGSEAEEGAAPSAGDEPSRPAQPMLDRPGRDLR